MHLKDASSGGAVEKIRATKMVRGIWSQAPLIEQRMGWPSGVPAGGGGERLTGMGLEGSSFPILPWWGGFYW